MPGYDRFWLDDGQRRAPIAKACLLLLARSSFVRRSSNNSERHLPGMTSSFLHESKSRPCSSAGRSGIGADHPSGSSQPICLSVLFQNPSGGPCAPDARSNFPSCLRGWKATERPVERQACSSRNSGCGSNPAGSSFSILKTSEGL
jgi:hypothetical protein